MMLELAKKPQRPIRDPFDDRPRDEPTKRVLLPGDSELPPRDRRVFCSHGFFWGDCPCCSPGELCSSDANCEATTFDIQADLSGFAGSWGNPFATPTCSCSGNFNGLTVVLDGIVAGVCNWRKTNVGFLNPPCAQIGTSTIDFNFHISWCAAGVGGDLELHRLATFHTGSAPDSTGQAIVVQSIDFPGSCGSLDFDMYDTYQYDFVTVAPDTVRCQVDFGSVACTPGNVHITSI